MFTAPESQWLVPYDGTFEINRAATKRPDNGPDKEGRIQELQRLVSELDELQRMFYADDKQAMLLIFQGMDAAGKDSTIRSILQGINPADCQVFSFRQPTSEELDHDFLWRTSRRLPERGRIGVFNRSYYEEVLIVRVHPELLGFQKLPPYVNHDNVWANRYASIRVREEHLA